MNHEFIVFLDCWNIFRDNFHSYYGVSLWPQETQETSTLDNILTKFIARDVQIRAAIMC